MSLHVRSSCGQTGQSHSHIVIYGIYVDCLHTNRHPYAATVRNHRFFGDLISFGESARHYAWVFIHAQLIRIVRQCVGFVLIAVNHACVNDALNNIKPTLPLDCHSIYHSLYACAYPLLWTISCSLAAWTVVVYGCLGIRQSFVHPTICYTLHKLISLRDSRRGNPELKTHYFGAFQYVWLHGRSWLDHCA